ncbi:MAG: TIGR02588 family protein [Hydrococcus sp. Prado102]|jgi:uncharacterized protein (TIGR02588 family)|nr:TIGR02588 family protein [Hydrococcus sp. Prado102]
MKQTLSHQKSEKNQRQRTTLAEWVTFLLSLAVVALIVGLVLHSWMTQSDEPPILQVTGTTEIREVQGQFYVPFTVENLGGETAESVQVISEIEQNGQVVETGEQQIDFLSANEKQEGAFIFTRDPRQGNYNVRVGSYKLP